MNMFIFTPSTLALLNNYNRFVGNTEDMNPTEKQETWTFMRAISSTGPINELHKYLVKKGMASTSMNVFIQELYKMWFYRYKRLGYRDSSGFEHVFVGEISRGVVSGFHNWLQLYYLERNNQVDYRGFLKYYNVEPSRVKLQIFWGKYKKAVTSLFLGTSPEFDIALYTLCFLVNPGKSCSCRINGENIPVTTHSYYGGKFVGSAYVRI
ncbi:poly(U)-specific endoribonuclease-A-like isoform X2 [Paramuricea clavata]|uniref:Uridylate-specific endoribonuclease n=1 Tax=Paramuricea clavata TaxID=317549 RepID=A0A7D9INJ4_PARCT|nr:poly(U)-specific endoribonuclease-A-like isoform X2 [Paramuricea clavata]